MTPQQSDAAPAPGAVVVPVPDDAAARDALVARLTALTAVRHPHLVPVLEVQNVRPGAFDVVRAQGEAADLPAVIAVRGRLSPAEAAAVGVHVAQAFAALHAAGLVHGPLEPADVVLRGGGAPALRPRVTLPPEEWTSAEDVRAVARLVDALLGSRTPATASPGDPVIDPAGALRNALAPALAADGRRRPEAGTLAALVDGACEPCEIRLPDPATLAAAALTGARRPVTGPVATGPLGAGRTATVRTASQSSLPRPASGPRRRRVPRAAVVVVGAGILVGVVTGAVLQLREPHVDAVASPVASPLATAASRAPEPTPSAADPVLDRSAPAEAAAALTQRRLDLLAAPDGADVATVDLDRSAAFAADTALLARLADAGTVPVEPRADVTRSVVVAQAGTSARVRVEYVVAAHRQRAADGSVVEVAASGSTVSVLRLVWTSQGWRVDSVA